MKQMDSMGSFSISTSSDSDSDPEGGEVPEVPFVKEQASVKKVLKKKRSERAAEERIEKLTRKREVGFNPFSRATHSLVLFANTAKPETCNRVNTPSSSHLGHSSAADRQANIAAGENRFRFDRLALVSSQSPT